MESCRKKELYYGSSVWTSGASVVRSSMKSQVSPQEAQSRATEHPFSDDSLEARWLIRYGFQSTLPGRCLHHSNKALWLSPIHFWAPPSVQESSNENEIFPHIYTLLRVFFSTFFLLPLPRFLALLAPVNRSLAQEGTRTRRAGKSKLKTTGVERQRLSGLMLDEVAHSRP